MEGTIFTCGVQEEVLAASYVDNEYGDSSLQRGFIFLESGIDGLVTSIDACDKTALAQGCVHQGCLK